MSITVFGIYDSTDAAEFASNRIRHTLQGVHVLGISNRIDAVRDEAGDRFLYPVSGQYIGGGNMFYTNYTALPMGFFINTGRNSHYEPARREDAALRIEVPDEETARKTASLMRSTGGTQVQQVNR